MRRFLASLAFILMAVEVSFAQEPFDPTQMPPMRMVFSQQISSAKGKVLSTGTGTIDVQYPNFYIVMGNMHIFGNDKVIYCKDTKSDEVTISNSVLQQLVKDADIKEVQKSATLGYTAKDGTKHSFTLTEAEFRNEPWPESHFQLTDDKIGENTIVTDMR